MKLFKCAVLACLALVLAGCGGESQLYRCSFATGQWDPAEWTLAKSPRWDHFGRWIQRDTHIENQTPPDAEPAQMLGPRAGETYTSMVLNRKFSGAVTVRATMEFTHRMAPLIVLTGGLGEDANGRAEHREHYEVVIYDEGVNVWHHYFKDGKPSWVKAAASKFTLEPNVRYELKVSVQPAAKGGKMSVSVGGYTLEYQDKSIPDELYVGITGCEGVNRFYDFSVSR